MSTTRLLEKDEMARVLERLASQILERHAACQDVMLVGIERRGADLARRIAALLQARLDRVMPLGTLQAQHRAVTHYRKRGRKGYHSG